VQCFSCVLKLSLLALVVSCAARGAPPPQMVGHVSPLRELQGQIADNRASCGDAAAQIQSATRGLRPPDRPVTDAVRRMCTDDRWTPDAIECFSKMSEGDLAQCAEQLDPDSRDSLLAELGGKMPPRDQVALARARLSVLRSGVDECDRFIIAVSNALSCEAVPLDARVQLGSETADLWSLPTNRMSKSVKAQMAQVCGTSREALEQQVTDAGCMP
jgi:hypothetical protein